jgi:hypothetical protein
MKIAWSAALSLLIVLSVGCGKRDNRGRIAIQGAVTYAGKPIDDGKIILEPTVPKLPMASGNVQSGRYEITADRGPAAGSYLVRLKAFRKKKDPTLDRHPYAGDNQEVGMVSEQYMPRKYNADSAVTVEIEPDGDGTYNFDLPQ